MAPIARHTGCTLGRQGKVSSILKTGLSEGKITLGDLWPIRKRSMKQKRKIPSAAAEESATTRRTSCGAGQAARGSRVRKATGRKTGAGQGTQGGTAASGEASGTKDAAATAAATEEGRPKRVRLRLIEAPGPARNRAWAGRFLLRSRVLSMCPLILAENLRALDIEFALMTRIVVSCLIQDRQCLTAAMRLLEDDLLAFENFVIQEEPLNL